MRMLEFIQKIWDINIEYQKANWRLLMEFPLEIIGTCVTIIVIGLAVMLLPTYKKGKK